MKLEIVKLPAHSAGFPGNDLLFNIVPLDPAQHAPVNPSALRPKGRGLLRGDPEPCSFTLSSKMGLGVAERANMRGWLDQSKTFALLFFTKKQK